MRAAGGKALRLRRQRQVSRVHLHIGFRCGLQGKGSRPVEEHALWTHIHRGGHGTEARTFWDFQVHRHDLGRQWR